MLFLWRTQQTSRDILLIQSIEFLKVFHENTKVNPRETEKHGVESPCMHK